MIRLFTGVLLVSASFAQMTTEQKLQDFRQLASLYAKHYAPYEWKRDALNFDLFDIQPWLQRVAATTDDLAFYDVCIDYVAGLNDGHVNFLLPSDFRASLPFSVDLYDNTPLVESINRARMPASRYPIAIGDEVVSLDGVFAEELIYSLAKYAVSANDRSTARIAASYLTNRSQRLIPHAIDTPNESTVVFRSAEGDIKTMTIPWTKTGTPFTQSGPVPSPKSAMERAVRSSTSYLEPGDPSWMSGLRMLANVRSPRSVEDAVLGFGAVNPVFRMPDNFRQRLGRSQTDAFFSGTYDADGLVIGFIRIPSFSPSNTTLALSQFAAEIQFMQENTAGLIIDDTRNPGGNACYLEALMTMIMPEEFRGIGFEVRASNFFVQVFSQNLATARAQNADQWVIDLLEALLNDVRQANSELRGKTGPLPLCAVSLQVQPARDRQGRVVAYNKPMMVLADDMSASGGDIFPAVFQDNRRGPVFGWRTMGLGGSVGAFTHAAVFGEGDARITWTQLSRGSDVTVPGYPSSRYIENVGVWPDITYDYQTRDNLMNSGQPYVEAFTRAMVEHIRATLR